VTIKQNDEVQLAPFCEIVGVYHGLYADDRYLYAKIWDKILLFVKGSDEAEMLRKKLANNVVGSAVGVLKTDLEKEPIRLRILAKASREK